MDDVLMVSIISVCACSASSLFMRTPFWLTLIICIFQLFIFFYISMVSAISICASSASSHNLISYVSTSSASSSFVCTPANSNWPCFFYFSIYLHEHKTQCKIEFTYASHSVSKNLTLRRMLKNSFLIAQIIRWNNSFQNMYDMI